MKSRFILKSLLLLIMLISLSMGMTMIAANAAVTDADYDLSAKSDRWFDREPLTVDAEAGDFSLIVMGDQQTALYDHPKFLYETYDWVAENKEAANIKMFINVGDIFNTVEHDVGIIGQSWADPNIGMGTVLPTYKEQAPVVSELVKKLEDAQIPVALCMGNHDYEDLAYNYRMNYTFDKTFPKSRFEGYDYFGGSCYDDIDAAYYYFSSGETSEPDYMVVTLGMNPTSDMLAWANKIVAENEDKKVIIVTHEYFQSEGDRTPRGQVVWNDLVSRHENICMVFSGHDWINRGEILKKVDIGANGNAVYQFMINSQGEEFGGAGLISQFVFRADGSVDVVYFAPGFETEQYFMESCQFTFRMEAQPLDCADSGQVVLGNSIDSDTLDVDFSAYSNNAWLQDVYAYQNVRLGKWGLETDGTGSLTYLLRADDGYRFKGMTCYLDGALEALADGVSAIQIEVSRDNEEYQIVQYYNSDIAPLCRTYAVDDAVMGAKELYVRIVMDADENSYITSLTMAGKSVKTVHEETNGAFSLHIDYSPYANFAEGWDGDAYDSLDCEILGGILGTGREGDYISSSMAFVSYLFEGGEGRTFDTFLVDLTMRICDITTVYDLTREYTWREPNDPYQWRGVTFDENTPYALKILISYDGGETYTLLRNYFNYENLGENVRIYADISDEVAGKDSFLLRLEYLGVYWNDVGFRTMDFSGSYRYDIAYETSGGTLPGDAADSYTGGDEVLLPVPVKDGYSFAGWYENAACTGEPVTSIAQGETGAKKYYAKWSDQPAFVLNGGNFSGGIAHVPYRDGYRFTGWFLDQTLTQKAGEDDFTGSNTLYAGWEKVNSVVYFLDGGTNASSNVSVLAEGQSFELEAPVREGMYFVGWFDGDGAKVTRVTGGDDVVLYAIWSETPVSDGSAASVVFGCLIGVVAGAAVVAVATVAVVLIRKKKGSEQK